MANTQFAEIDLDALTTDNAGTDALSLPASNLINSLGGQIAATMSPIDLTADVPQEMFFTGLMLDNSPSMAWHNACGKPSYMTVAEQHALVIKTMLDKKVDPNSEILTFLLNQHPLYVQRSTGDRNAKEFTWASLGNAPKLLVPRVENDMLTGGTPLYERARVFLASIKARALYWEQSENLNTRSVSAILSDGASSETDADQRKYADECALLVKELRKDRKHRILFVGFDDGSTDFAAVARRMGIPDHDVKLVTQNSDDLAEFFMRFSQLSATASQTNAPVDNIAL